MQHALKLGPVAVLPEQKSSIFRFSLLDGLSLVTKLHEPNWKGQTKRRQQNQEGKVPSDILSRGTEAARGILLTHLGKCGCLLTERVPWDIHTGRCLPLQCRYGCSLRCYCDSLQFLGRKGRSAHPARPNVLLTTKSLNDTAQRQQLVSQKMRWKPLFFNCTFSCVCHFTLRLSRNSVEKCSKSNPMLQLT